MVTDESPPPLYSPNSEEIAIQNGYSNSVACQDYWGSCPYVTEEGFTEAYQRMDYTAVGQTTHLAARLEQLSRPGSTLLAADTLRLAEGYVEVKPLGPVPVKGLETPVEVYELIGAGPRRSRLHAAAMRGLTRFVGREGELEQLRQTLSQAAGGHGQIVAIVGEPGVGKSRLVWEVMHSHRTHGGLILQGSSVSYGKATPICR